MTNAVIAGNHATDGGGVFIDKSGFSVFNSTIVANHASGLGGGIHVDSHESAPDMVIRSCILYENTAGDAPLDPDDGQQLYVYGDPDIAVTRCDLEDGEDGIGTSYLDVEDVYVAADSLDPPQPPQFVEGVSGTWNAVGISWSKDTGCTTFTDSDATEDFGEWTVGQLVVMPDDRYAVVAYATTSTVSLWGDWVEVTEEEQDYQRRTSASL